MRTSYLKAPLFGGSPNLRHSLRNLSAVVRAFDIDIPIQEAPPRISFPSLQLFWATVQIICMSFSRRQMRARRALALPPRNLKGESLSLDPRALLLLLALHLPLGGILMSSLQLVKRFRVFVQAAKTNGPFLCSNCKYTVPVQKQNLG